MKKYFLSLLMVVMFHVSLLSKIEIVNAKQSNEVDSLNVESSFIKKGLSESSARNKPNSFYPFYNLNDNNEFLKSEETIKISSEFIAQLISEQLNINFQYLFTKTQIEEITKLEIMSNEQFKETDLLEIAKLFNLRELKLDNLNLTDIEPLSNNSQLEIVDLRNNQIKDISPLADLANLKRVNLTSNRLEEIGSLANMSNLEYLYLGNNLIQNVQSLSTNSNLLELYVDNNPINEVNIVESMSFLRKLSIKGTFVTDFQVIARVQSLIYLSIGGVAIENKDIICLSSLEKLVELRMTNTLISDLTSLSQLTNMTKLILNNNRIVNVEPLSNLSQLKYLDLDNNQIKDINALANLSYLTGLYLSYNQIDSIQPVKNSVTRARNQQISAPMVEVWDGQLIRENEIKLEGLEAMGELSIVAELDGHYHSSSNQIKWTTLNELEKLPAKLGYTFSFTNDDRYSGEVSFRIEGFVHSPKIESLRSTETKIKGIGKYGATILAKVDGQLIGESKVLEDQTFEIPIEPQKTNTKVLVTQVMYGKESLTTELIVDLVQASDFDHQKWLINEINQQLAPKKIDKDLFFDDLEKIETILLNNKKLEGSIPTGISYLTNLRELDLDTNRLTGKIPDSIDTLSQLTQLMLSNNQLTGILPIQLANLKKIEKIDLMGNQLTGAIPRSIGNLVTLKELRLNRNQLNESVPTSIGSLSNIKILDFSSNQLTGSIPSNLSNLENLETLNFSSNQLAGEVPASIGYLEHLQILNLGNNKLSGTIPASIGNLTNLQTFDVQNNQLVGKLDNIVETLALVSHELYIQGNQLTINSNELPVSIASQQKWENNFIQDKANNPSLSSYHLKAKDRVYPDNNRIYLFDSSKGDAFLDLHGEDQDNQSIDLWPKHTYQILNEQGIEIYNGPADPDYFIEWDGSFKYQIILDGAAKNSNNVLTFLVGEGGLSIFTSVPTLDFQPAIVEQLDLVKRKQKDWGLKVSDTRMENRRSPWRVTISLAENFTSLENELKNPLVFALDNLIESIPYGKTHTIYTQKNPIEGETTIRWKDGEGVLLKIPQGSYRGNYEGTLNFTIVDSI
ncbi:leucine-rich repeat domain-containing protein [Carnobacterium maltaromaticum]|uniref:leucine-rich repeat domain-containing protein n=1 Tax=Carnobacterium maltaromaticum TaxID=2751 RepID=UPI0039AED872